MNRKYVSGLVYQETPPFPSWFKWILIGIPGVTLVIGISLAAIDLTGTWFLIGTAALEGLLFYFIIPRKYQIFEDKIRIAMGSPFAVSIRFSNLREVKAAPASSAYAASGLRLATSGKTAVEIVRKKGLSVIISPRDRDLFLQYVNQTMQTYRNMHPESL